MNDRKMRWIRTKPRNRCTIERKVFQDLGRKYKLVPDLMRSMMEEVE